MTDVLRYRLDDLRRFATALGIGAGVAPVRAAALASHLLWFDAAGAGRSGIETLPHWLERIAGGEVDPVAEGSVREETLGTVLFDGRNGIAPLILARAGELAIEKARDAGTGLVRVVNLGPAGPAAAIVAEMAVGPVLALVLGPGPAFALGLPTDEGLPAILDLALDPESSAAKPKKGARGNRTVPVESWAPWALAMVPEGGRLVAAVGIKTIEPLSSFHTRVGARMKELPEGPGRLLPATWEAHRRNARERGVAVTVAVRTRLDDWALRLGIAQLPAPTHSPPSAPSSSGAL